MKQKNSKRYFPYSEYLKEIFNDRVFKITIDAGFACPNRDGTISSKGCIFCDEGGSFSGAHDKKMSVEEQVRAGIEYLTLRHKANKFLAYFQAFTNTYKPLNDLKTIYDSAFCDKRVVGISIGTRPDCVDDDKLDLIASYPQPQIEFGLQSSHNKTLELINRGHTYETFEKAYLAAKKRGIKICVHVILGLMSENREMMLETAKKLAELEIDGIKIHALTLLKGSILEKEWGGKLKLLDEETYANLVCDFLELLPPKTAVHRFAGSGLRSKTIKPDWVNRKFHTQNLIDRIFWERDSHQGKFYK